MEIMGVDWLSIQLMPYKFFIETIIWKNEFEKKKAEQLKEASPNLKRESRIKSAMKRRGKDLL